ncbi:MAG: CoA transferase [Alphaproteobacteria bacterium]|nr:CoA transferase [Alphaproteobacteria bacterium]
MGLLDGVKVIEVGQALVGPYTGMILADMGADVIKIEKPNGGDDARLWGPPFKDGYSHTFRAFNRNKRSVVLDLKNAGDVEKLKRLTLGADIFIQNLRPGVTGSIGIAPDDMLTVNPRLIYCNITAFGRQGPMARHPGMDPLVQAYCAVMTMTGRPEDPPTFSPPPINDKATGMWAAIGALAALQDRARTGKGHVIDASLFESGVGWVESQLNNYVNAGVIPQRTGAASANIVPYQTFKTMSEDICIAAGNDRLFVKFAGVVGAPEWTEDSRFKGARERAENRLALLSLIAEKLLQKPCVSWIEALEAVGVPCSVVNAIAGLAASEQLRAVDLMRDMPNEDLRMVGLPFEIDAERPQNRRPAPTLGQHTDEVLAEI